jgi:hypothetical protein
MCGTSTRLTNIHGTVIEPAYDYIFFNRAHHSERLVGLVYLLETGAQNSMPLAPLTA